MDEKAFLAKSNPLALAGALGDGETDGPKEQATDVIETKVPGFHAFTNMFRAPNDLSLSKSVKRPNCCTHC